MMKEMDSAPGPGANRSDTSWYRKAEPGRKGMLQSSKVMGHCIERAPYLANRGIIARSSHTKGLRAGSAMLAPHCFWQRTSVVVLAAMPMLFFVPAAAAEDRSNFFNDPFIQITRAVSACPVPAGPLFTEEEARSEAHARSQRGVSCYLAGRCRMSNAYLYDREIIPRVAIAIESDGGFADSSVWALGQRRWVWLMGCVRSEEQSQALEALVRRIDDVETVINQLTVGTSGKPAYEVKAAPAPR